MTEEKPNYDKYLAENLAEQERKKIQHTIYLSRRAIWANVILIILFSGFAGYIHTRRWKALGILFAVFCVIGGGVGLTAKSLEESFEKGAELGANLAPLISLIAAVDNGTAIYRARKKIAGHSSE